MDEINTLGQLMRAIALAHLGGYETFEVDIQQEHSGGGFLIVTVSDQNQHDRQVVTDYVEQEMFGEFWFDADDKVMQVL
jgi:hypothetical protein